MMVSVVLVPDASTSGMRNSVRREGGRQQHSHGGRCDRREFSASLQKLTPVVVFSGHSANPPMLGDTRFKIAPIK